MMLVHKLDHHNFMGVDETADIVGVGLYPNPAEQSTSLIFDAQFDGTATISIIDLTGKVVRTFGEKNFEAGKNTYVLNIEGLTSGVYVVNMNTGNSQFTQKLIVR